MVSLSSELEIPTYRISVPSPGPRKPAGLLATSFSQTDEDYRMMHTTAVSKIRMHDSLDVCAWSVGRRASKGCGSDGLL